MSTPESSTKAVVAALSANSLVTLLKLVAFLLSGSGAMLSEAVHSAADTGNQLLLFIGLKRGSRERDEDFHYGYGGERFIFGLLSASGIFFVGSGVTIYHGIGTLLHPQMPALGAVTFVVLALSFVIEGSVLWFAIHVVNKQRGASPFFRYVRERADPATVAILLEDGAAVLGLVLAAGGIALAKVTNNPLWDSVGSIVVGILLGVVALYLVLENRELLMGKAVPEGVRETFINALQSRGSVKAVRDIKTRQLTPEAYVMKAEVVLEHDFVVRALDRALPGKGDGLDREAMLRMLASHAIHAISQEIDAVEAAVRVAIPEAVHIDIELDHIRGTSDETPPSQQR